jgi:hypothetical protein
MIALSDEALARLVIGASRVRPNARARWPQDLARRLDPDPRPLTRQGRWRQRQRNGSAIFRLELNVERGALIEGDQIPPPRLMIINDLVRDRRRGNGLG